MQNYSQTIRSYFEKIEHVGCLNPNAPLSGQGMAGTAKNGDVVKISIQLNPNHTILHALFKAQGSVVTLAACAWITEWLPGKTIKDVMALDATQLLEALHAPPLKRHCLLLVCEALKKAIEDAIR